MKMKFKMLLLACFMKYCSGAKLNPLENNDRLQDINNLFVAEWQWESWPIKQGASELNTNSPGGRVNFALWRDSSGLSWYLFGGQSVDAHSRKIYSDLWKYSVKNRVWGRLFPSQEGVKSANFAKIGTMTTLRDTLFDENHSFDPSTKNYKLVLCGSLLDEKPATFKKQNIWQNFPRRKTQEVKDKKNELKSVAVYSPRISESIVVWKMDLRDNLWTTYVCCSDANTNKSSNISENRQKIKTSTEKDLKISNNIVASNNEFCKFDLKINKATHEVNGEQQHLTVNNLSNKKEKTNQNKLLQENIGKKQTQGWSKDNKAINSILIQSVNLNPKHFKKVGLTTKKEKYIFNMGLPFVPNLTVNSEQAMGQNITAKSEKMFQTKEASKYCPEFIKGSEVVTWCDGNDEVLIAADINSPKFTLWIFNLTTTHWSQQSVKVANNEWPGCSNDTLRYAGYEESVYLFCSPIEKQNENSSEVIKKTAKAVYRINVKNRSLEGIGEIFLSSFFGTLEGRRVWRNKTTSHLHVFRTPVNETILLLAYLDFVDLWLLNEKDARKVYFDEVNKIWRGSALKWFKKYNAAIYNFQFFADTGNSETILMPNPRNIVDNEYWPRDRGRFIIRIFKNENLRNQTSESRGSERNLTFELLQSDFKAATSSGGHSNHSYSLKVLIFFGISLTIFAVFGLVVFVKRCTTFQLRVHVQNNLQKSPPVIRYSVIPDDLLHPVA